VKVKDKTLFFSPKGQAKSLTGKTVETLKLKCTEVKSGSLDLMGHTDFNGAQATYYDVQQGKQEHVYVGRAPFKKITGHQASQAEAQDIAQAELETLQRKKKRLKLVCTLQPTAFAECLIELDTSFHPMLQGRYSVDDVVLSCLANGQTQTQISATLTK
tara:strand:- start:3334 stop:3810 length:477 start_codon:yes stop_codon:yes gene_type:complete